MGDPVRQSNGVGFDQVPEHGIQVQKDNPPEEEAPEYGSKAKAAAEADTASNLNVKEFM